MPTPDYGILFRGQPQIRPADPVNAFLQAEQVNNARSDRDYRNSLLQNKLASASRANAQDSATANALAQMGGLAGGGAQYGSEGVNKLLSYRQVKEKSAREEEAHKIDMTARLLTSVAQNPEIYPMAREEAIRSGLGTEETIPAEYDPNWVNMTRQRALEMQQSPDYLRAKAQAEAEGKRAGGADVLSPEALRQKMQIAQAGKTDINLGTQEKEEAKAFGKSLVKRFDDISERADAAEDSISQLEIARRIPVNSGQFAPIRTVIAGMAQDIGVDPESLGLDRATDAQAYRGILNNLVLSKMQAQKGPQTENDAKRIEQTLSNLSNTPEANDFLIRSAMALERRKVEQRDFYLTWREKEGTLAGAESAWNKFKRKTPLVGTNPKSGLPVFFSEYRQGIRENNPDFSDDDILRLWRKKYGR